MDKLHSGRLTRLADALEHDEHGHKRWDFNRVLVTVKCGSVGCAIGALPYVFPKDFCFKDSSFPDMPWVSLRDGNAYDKKAAQEFFGLSMEEATHLFYPKEQEPKLYGGRVLGERAKPQSVAKNIRAFLEVKARESR